MRGEWIKAVRKGAFATAVRSGIRPEAGKLARYILRMDEMCTLDISYKL